MKESRIWRLIAMLMVISAVGLFGGCVPTEGASSEQGGMSNILMIGFFILIGFMLYFTMIRPQRKRMKEHQEMMASLQKGDKVITAGGIYGEIDTIRPDSYILKVESGTTIRITKGSVIGKAPED